MLYIVATPIGNLADITYRAVEVLRQVDLIIAEDTRTSSKLLAHYEIDTSMSSFHSYSSDSKIESIVEKLKDEQEIAMISDAGTPGISDPSFKLIQLALAAGVEVVPIPGVSAVITALSVSGAPIDKFIYLGFLPVKKGRKSLLEELAGENRTLVLYESVHRIEKTLKELLEYFGDRYVCVGREMTKKFEEFFRGDLSEAIEYFVKNKPKGEFTVVVSPASFRNPLKDVEK